MSELYTFHASLHHEGEIPSNGILSRTLQNDARSKVIQFTFAPGTELTAHTAPMPATLYFVSGEGELQLGEDTMSYGAGAFAYMTPKLEHAIRAKTQTVMLLTMVKGVEPPAKA
jgi:quercetin dioxygenase-like cupin family protein